MMLFIKPHSPGFVQVLVCANTPRSTHSASRCDGQYDARCTLNSCLVGVVIALPQKRSDESNDTLVDNTKGISCFGIRDFLGNYCPSLP